jgi:hypothetical protein
MNLIKPTSAVGAGLADDLTIHYKAISKTRPYSYVLLNPHSLKRSPTRGQSYDEHQS